MTSTLINDHAAALAQVILEMLRLPSHQQPEAFRVICEACNIAFASYAENSAGMHRIVKPGNN
jgi:hypothetical protein